MWNEPALYSGAFTVPSTSRILSVAMSATIFGIGEFSANGVPRSLPLTVP
ncbi:MAG: hypothetical protein WDN01_01565 [Rhizomicrobium sp.]